MVTPCLCKGCLPHSLVEHAVAVNAQLQCTHAGDACICTRNLQLSSYRLCCRIVHLESCSIAQNNSRRSEIFAQRVVSEALAHMCQLLCQACTCVPCWDSVTVSVYVVKLSPCCSSARGHGRKDVGLPSRLASFKPSSMPPAKRGKLSWWQQNQQAQAGLQGDGLASQVQQQQDEHAEAGVSSIVVKNRERRHWAQPWRHNKEQMQQPVCTLHLPPALQGWHGPRLKLSLPSFRCVCCCIYLHIV